MKNIKNGGKTRAEIYYHPLPYQAHNAARRFLCRFTVALSRRHILAVQGLEYIQPHCDPFVIVLNHNQRWEALIIPTLMMYQRGGKLIHFLADWNFCLIPFVSVLYHAGEVIILTHKPARPTFLNIFKPLFTHPVPAFTRALNFLQNGASVGIFPEGTVNRDPRNLLHGHYGAARLSLQAGVPIVPAGIRFPQHDPTRPITESAPLELEIGAPLQPPYISETRPNLVAVKSWHTTIMMELARLSGKNWISGI